MAHVNGVKVSKLYKCHDRLGGFLRVHLFVGYINGDEDEWTMHDEQQTGPPK